MEEIVKCPICGKRIFDLTWRSDTTIKTKCRHCNNVVSVTRRAADNSPPAFCKQLPLRHKQIAQ